MTDFAPVPAYAARHARDLYRQIQAEADVLRRLMASPPWVVRRGDEADENTGLRAAFRRWTPVAAPTPATEGAVYAAIPADATLRQWSEDEQEAAVARLVAVLNLVALGWRGSRTMKSVGAACAGTDAKKVLISNTRFSRLLTAPPDPALRVQALGRAFRQFKRAGLAISPDDAPNLLRFLFSPEPQDAVRRWAGDYFRITFPGDRPDAPADASTPTA